MTTRGRDLLEVAAVYGAVGSLGAGTLGAVHGELIFRAGVTDLVMTFAIFAVSLWRSNSSVYDAYWSVIPSLLTVWLGWHYAGESWTWMHWAVMGVVNLWSWRLTHNWARSWPGWHHEDWRYVDLREQHGRAFQFTNLFGIHLFPTVIVFLACLGLFDVARAESLSLGWTLAGCAVGLLGVLLELVADNQLLAFRRRPEPRPEELLQTGLWGVVRHPNYLGEMLFWWGVALCGLGAGGAWWVTLGAVAMVLLFVLASSPMKDRRMEARRPAYAAHRSRVSALIPGVW
ncbi:MAG: DUF1295 domain-containing protein [Myxococcota bacterium]|nr:DUF1295 domain-containing protein [Myxococcota bacterium]